MKLVNATESDLEDATSSASEWMGSKTSMEVLKDAKTNLNPNVRIVDVSKPEVVETTHREDNTMQSEEELIKNQIDIRILELRKLLEAKRSHKEGQSSS